MRWPELEGDMGNLRQKLVPLCCIAILVQACAASGQTIDPSFRSDIQKLLEVTRSAQLGAQGASLILGQILDGLKKSQPPIPDRAVALAKEVLDSEFAKAFAGPDNLTDQMVLIYARHFTQEDVHGLLAFYSSDLGKKTIASMPAVLQEAVAAGQQWAEKQMPRIVTILQTRLRAEGFIK
jgi:hypothetical protein